MVGGGCRGGVGWGGKYFFLYLWGCGMEVRLKGEFTDVKTLWGFMGTASGVTEGQRHCFGVLVRWVKGWMTRPVMRHGATSGCLWAGREVLKARMRQECLYGSWGDIPVDLPGRRLVRAKSYQVGYATCRQVATCGLVVGIASPAFPGGKLGHRVLTLAAMIRQNVGSNYPRGYGPHVGVLIPWEGSMEWVDLLDPELTLRSWPPSDEALSRRGRLSRGYHQRRRMLGES